MCGWLCAHICLRMYVEAFTSENNYCERNVCVKLYEE